MVWTVESQNKKTPGYAAYHQQVVDGCVAIWGEDTVAGWYSCSFVDEFLTGRDPGEVVQDQLDACD